MTSLLLYVPSADHLDKAFVEVPKDGFGGETAPAVLPEADWRASGATALWDIATAQVLWSPGARTRAEVRAHGKRLDDWREELKPQGESG